MCAVSAVGVVGVVCLLYTPLPVGTIINKVTLVEIAEDYCVQRSTERGGVASQPCGCMVWSLCLLEVLQALLASRVDIALHLFQGYFSAC